MKDAKRVKAGKHAKNKGKTGEREVAKVFLKHGWWARRGQQFKGGEDSPDVVTDFPHLHVEVKRTESFSMWKALEQASGERKGGDIPIVFHRKNDKPWVVVMEADEFFDLVERLQDESLSRGMAEGNV